MPGKGLILICLLATVLFQSSKFSRASPLYSLPSLADAAKYSLNNKIIVAEVDRPLDTVLEAVMELGGNILLLVPQKDFEKRDPPGPDLGTGRSYSGQRTAKVMWGQLASNSPTGPGRKKRNSTDGGGSANFVFDSEYQTREKPEDLYLQ